MPGRAAQDRHPWNSSHRQADWLSLLMAQVVGGSQKPCLLVALTPSPTAWKDAGGIHSAQQG